MEKIMLYIERFLFAAILIFNIVLVVKLLKTEKAVQTLPATIHTEIIIHDTITQVQWKDRTAYRTDTVLLPVIDTIIDSVTVQVPIDRYVFDTTTEDGRVKITATGYNVEIDTIQMDRKITSDTIFIPYQEKKWRFGWGFAVGIGWLFSK